MKTHIRINRLTRGIVSMFLLGIASLAMMAQTSLPAPGSGGSFRPNTGGPGPVIGISPAPGMGPGMGPGWGGGPAWGSPWGPAWNSPSVVVNTVPGNAVVTKVISCGYDAQGIWRVVPLTVSFQYNGVFYNVNVINAWNPWTNSWDRGIDVPAYSTSYYLNGNTYDYYVPLSFGTFYFNL